MTTITTLAKFVESRRLDLGIESQTELARRAGVPRETVNRIERGLTQNPEADIRRRLAKALGVSHLELLVAAGEITEAELGDATGVVERDPDPRRDALLQRLRSAALDAKWLETFEGMVALAERGANRG